MFLIKYIVPGLCWLLTFGLTSSYGAESKERFSNFYTVPANLELIAMPSDGVGDRIQPSNNEPQSDKPANEAFSSPPSSSESEAESEPEPRFSIGLGTLAPSYSQKFGVDGQTRLDFDHRANGFSYTLTNHHHPQTPEPTAFSDIQKDQYSAKESNSEISLSPQPTKMNIKIYHDQSHQPISNSPSTAETRNFYSEMRPSSGFYNFSPKSRTLNIPNESRYHELVEKYAPKEEDDGIDSFFDKEPLIGSKGSWSSDRPSFDDMPDFPDPNFHESETPSSTTEPPHHTAPRSSRSHSSPPSNSPRQGRYHDDDHPHPRPHSHPDSHSRHRSHPHSHPHSHRQSHRSRSHSHPNSNPHSYSNPQSSSRSQNHPPPYSHPPVPSRPPPTHYRSAEHSDDSSGKVYDDLRGYEQGLGSNHHLSSFESPSPYFTPGSDADDGNHRTIGSASGPIQFNSNIHHGSGSGELSFSKDNVLLSSSGPAGFEYINRIASSPQDEMNSFSFNSGSLEPVLFSANHEQDQYNGLAGSQDGFAAYIAGLPLAP